MEYFTTEMSLRHDIGYTNKEVEFENEKMKQTMINLANQMLQ
jgi:hypothetical protein